MTGLESLLSTAPSGLSFPLSAAAAAEGGAAAASSGFRYLAPLLALGLAVVHVFASRLWFLDGVPRSRALSFAGGVSVAYVFVHLFPEVQEAGATIHESQFGPLALFAEHHVYLVALAGFVAFYGLERFAQEAGGEREDPDPDPGPDVFWLHVGSFAAYNALVGYLLLHREEAGLTGLLLFFVAMALHFVVNDHGLREHHGELYRRRGRWVLAAAILVGTGVGLAVAVPEGILAVLFAFLAGGIVLNVIKEELPEERESRFPAFAAGAAGYAALLVIV